MINPNMVIIATFLFATFVVLAFVKIVDLVLGAKGEFIYQTSPSTGLEKPGSINPEMDNASSITLDSNNSGSNNSGSENLGVEKSDSNKSNIPNPISEAPEVMNLGDLESLVPQSNVTNNEQELVHPETFNKNQILQNNPNAKITMYDVGTIECDICTHKFHTAVRQDVDIVECPNCKQKTDVYFVEP